MAFREAYRKQAALLILAEYSLLLLIGIVVWK
jgi:hypothetical protein